MEYNIAQDPPNKEKLAEFAQAAEEKQKRLPLKTRTLSLLMVAVAAYAYFTNVSGLADELARTTTYFGLFFGIGTTILTIGKRPEYAIIIGMFSTAIFVALPYLAATGSSLFVWIWLIFFSYAMLYFVAHIHLIRKVHGHMLLTDKHDACIAAMEAAEEDQLCSDYILKLATQGRLPTLAEAKMLADHVKEVKKELPEETRQHLREKACRKLLGSAPLFKGRAVL